MNPTYQHYATHDESEYPHLWRGVVGSWAPCLGPSGTRLHDHSGRANWGTLTNMDPATDWVVNGGQYALDFDGVNDSVLSSLSVSTPQQLTIEGWVRTSASTRSGIITIGIGGDCVYMDVLATGVLRCAIEKTAGASYIFRDSSASVSGQGWKHVAMTATPSALNVFVDGRNVTTGGGSIGTITAIAGGTVQLGNGFASPYGGFLAGLLDSFTIANRVRPIAEIAELYQIGRGGMYVPRRRRRAYSYRPSLRRRLILTGQT